MNVVLKKYLPLQRFNKQRLFYRFKKQRKNEEISFNVRSYRSYLFRIMW